MMMVTGSRTLRLGVGAAGRLVLLLMLGAVGLAQQRDRPSAEAAPRPVGTALLAGVVAADADSDTPVRRAIVTLVSSDGTDSRSMVSDDRGRFAFIGLPAGRYTLTADKPAHLRNSFGALRPARPGTSIALEEGQQLADIRLALPRGAVITGSLRLATGEPLTDTQVIAIPIAQAEAGGRLPFSAVEFTSDDRGIYRIYGLEPGTYIVGALPLIGRGEIEVRTQSYEDVVRELTQQRAGGGGPPATAPAGNAPEPEMVGYAPTYYPGTPVAANAEPLAVGVGDVREGIDIAITMYQMSVISGIVTGVDGQPAQAVQISTETIGPPLPLASALSIRNHRPEAQGRFRITNVPPGHYRITAAGGGVTLNPDGSLQSLMSNEQTEWAVANVQVSGTNIDGLSLRLQPGRTFSGTLVSVGSGAAPASWLGTRITVQPVDAAGTGAVPDRSPTSGGGARSALADESGGFHVTGIRPGHYEVQVRLPTTMTGGWAVRSIRADGGDLRDAPLTFDAGSLDDVRITLTDERTTVTGALSSAAGTPASDYYIVIFAADRALWHPLSPRLQVVRPGADGTFTATDLPAGDYRIAALTDIDDTAWRTPAFLEQLLPASVVVVVRDGETTRQDIRIR